MEDFSKPFSQMTRNELYEVVREFRQEIKATLERNTEVEQALKKTKNELKQSTVAVRELTKKANSLNAGLERRNKKAADYFSEQRNEIALLKSTVESLVSQAALGNLGYSFSESKLKYGDENNGKRFRITTNGFVSFSLYAFFIASLSLVVLIFLLPFISLDPLGFNPPSYNTITLEGTLSRFLLSTPLLWLALHMSSKISQRAALYEEYNYKERLITTYIAFIKQYRDENVNSEFTRELLKHINKPPSITKKKVYSETFMDLCSAFIRRNRQIAENITKPDETQASQVARPSQGSDSPPTSNPSSPNP